MNRRFSVTLPVLVTLVLLSSCATGPLAYTKGTYDRPQTILINLPSDPRGWREDWRSAFESHGYKVLFQDETSVASSTDSASTERQGAQSDSGIPFEFHLSYHGVWDFVWYVHTVDLAVRDLRTGRVVANYSDENVWAHPRVKTVVEKIERDFLSTLWTSK